MHPSVYEYISAESNDPIIEWRTCAWSGEQFAITAADKVFYEKVSPVFPLWKIACPQLDWGGIEGDSAPDSTSTKSPLPLFTKEGENSAFSKLIAEWKVRIEWDTIRYFIPFPTLSPESRHQRRLAFMNWSHLYHRKCDFSGKDLIGQFPVEARVTVYERSVWDSDVWSAFDYGREYDASRPFFAQMSELHSVVPLPHNSSDSCENCPYSLAGQSKDCYLLAIGSDCENVHYSEWVVTSRDSIESRDSTGLERCSHCVEVTTAYNCHTLIKSENCTDVSYSAAMIGCSHCFLCHNLDNASYCIRNVEYTPEKWREEVARLKSNGSFEQYQWLQKEFEKLCLETTFPATKVIGSENCYGTNIQSSSDIVFGTWAVEAKSCKFWFSANYHNSDSYDTSSYFSSLCLESTAGGPTHHCLFCFDLRENNRDLLYCAYTLNCQDCFGCIGLKNAQYCILNKQYTKEEYEIGVPRIIDAMIRDQEWGEFFDPKLSAHSYDRSEAQLYRLLASDDVMREKFLHYEISPVRHDGIRSVPAHQLPDSIHESPDDILNWAIECQVSKKPFRLIAQELAFYRKHNLPIPRLHPEVRRMRRREYRSWSDFYLRSDEQWPFLSVYSEEYAGKVVRP